MIICQDPPDDKDSFRERIRPGTGTATGDVRLVVKADDGRGEDLGLCAVVSLFGEEYRVHGKTLLEEKD